MSRKKWWIVLFVRDCRVEHAVVWDFDNSPSHLRILRIFLPYIRKLRPFNAGIYTEQEFSVNKLQTKTIFSMRCLRRKNLRDRKHG